MNQEKIIACTSANLSVNSGSPLRNFKQYLESKGHSQKNIDNHYQNLCNYINWTEEQHIETEYASYNEVMSYVQYLKKRTIKQSTITIYINTLKHYYSWVIKRKLRTENPTRNIIIKGVQRKYLYDTLKKQTLENLYENFVLPKEDEGNKNQNWFKTSKLTSSRNKVILGLMIWQGLGTLELAKLEVKDVQLREGKINVSGSKRSNPRALKLEAPQILDLMEYTLQTRQEILKLSGNNKQSESLFVSIGKSNQFNNVMHQLKHKLHQQNPRITSLQQIRASVITNWLKNYNLREVQYKAGHRYVSSTEAYLVNDLEGLQEDIVRFHPIG